MKEDDGTLMDLASDSVLQIMIGDFCGYITIEEVKNSRDY